jgi:hypothetical protein
VFFRIQKIPQGRSADLACAAKNNSHGLNKTGFNHGAHGGHRDVGGLEDAFGVGQTLV